MKPEFLKRLKKFFFESPYVEEHVPVRHGQTGHGHHRSQPEEQAELPNVMYPMYQIKLTRLI